MLTLTDEMSIITLTTAQQAFLNAKLDAIKQEAFQKREAFEEMIEYLLREILLFSFRIKSEGNAAHISAAANQLDFFLQGFRHPADKAV